MPKHRRRRRLESPEPLGDVLAKEGEDRFARVRPPIAPFQWRRAVGFRVAERTLPVSLKGGVLLVRAATSAWATELSLLAPQIIEGLVALGFDVSRLRFIVGDVAVKPLVVQRPPRKAALGPLDPGLERSLAAVFDDELRETIEAAARASIPWQKTIEAPPAARAPRAAETENAPPGRTSPPAHEEAPGTRGGEPDRAR